MQYMAAEVPAKKYDNTNTSFITDDGFQYTVKDNTITIVSNGETEIHDGRHYMCYMMYDDKRLLDEHGGTSVDLYLVSANRTKNSVVIFDRLLKIQYNCVMDPVIDRYAMIFLLDNQNMFNGYKVSAKIITMSC